MIIECRGTRGSIARGGTEFSRYGGDTISVLIQSSKGDIIIVDAGTGIQSIGNNFVDSNTPIHIFFTHYHLDHIIGIPFFKPLFNPKQVITMYGPTLEGTNGVESAFKNIMSPPFSPISFGGEEIRSSYSFKTIGETEIQIGSIKVTTIGINHTNHGGLGYKFEENGKSFVLLTDNELKYNHKNSKQMDDFIHFCKDSDLLFHDAQFTQEEYDHVQGWGHSTIEDVLELGYSANCKEVGFFHYAPDRTDQEIEKLYNKQHKIGGNTKFFPIKENTIFNL